jgi:shikimate dehydrogenase
VIGSPIRHSRSPAIHNAAFAACGLDWTFVAFEVGEGGGAGAVAAARALGLRGLSVTMPLKAEVAAAVDELTPAAAALGAVNTVIVRGGRTIGDNTDGGGFVDSLPPGWELAGRRCLVLGAGGAARAIVWALADAGAAEVVVVNRDPAKAVTAAALAGPVGRVGAPADAAHVDLLVNATSVGMEGTPGAGRLPIDPSLVGPGQLVVDIVTHPAETPLMVAAANRGALVIGGQGMLVHQAARAFRAWTGHAAPVEAMLAAVRA